MGGTSLRLCEGRGAIWDGSPRPSQSLRGVPPDRKAGAGDTIANLLARALWDSCWDLDSRLISIESALSQSE